MAEVKWLEASVNAPAQALDEVCAKLIGAGVTGLEVEDEAEFLTFLEENRPYWDYVDQELLDRMRGVSRVKFYVTDDADGKAQLAHYTEQLGLDVTVIPLGDNDWATSWQKYYKPLPVGEKLQIVPAWERDQPVPDGRTAVVLNPGLTFGTGSHASTQLCLEGLEKLVRPGDRVLDLGCGSGILSIAALCLGAGFAAAADLDPKAADVAYENAALNGIGKDRYLVRAGNILSDRALARELAGPGCRLVLANIVADVIIPLSAFAGELMEPEGYFLCSGIIDTRSGEVQAALEGNGFTVVEKREKDGWCALTAVRK